MLGLWILATVVPWLALNARRLHDANLSGWMQMLGAVPYLGGLTVLGLAIQGSNPAGARFDADSGAASGLACGSTPYSGQPYGTVPYGTAYGTPPTDPESGSPYRAPNT